MRLSKFQDLASIYKAHSKWVFNLALHYLWSKEDAEEVTQDVFLKVHHQLSNFRGESQMKTWIYRITVNSSLDFLKAKKRTKRGGGLFFFSLNDDASERQFNHPGVNIEHQEEVEAIMRKIAMLPKKQMESLILHKVEGYSLAETAALMQLSNKTIEGLITKAKKNLKEKLESHQDSDLLISSNWIISNETT
jgi:RNA polymerase sigma-70 factor (ECF subfamily)